MAKILKTCWAIAKIKSGWHWIFQNVYGAKKSNERHYCNTYQRRKTTFALLAKEQILAADFEDFCVFHEKVQIV